MPSIIFFWWRRTAFYLSCFERVKNKCAQNSAWLITLTVERFVCRAVRQENRCRHLRLILRPNDCFKLSYLTLICMHGVMYLGEVASTGAVAPLKEDQRGESSMPRSLVSWERSSMWLNTPCQKKKTVEYLVRKGKVHITVHVVCVLLKENHVDRTNALQWITSLFRLERHRRRQALYSPIKNMFFTCAHPWKKIQPWVKMCLSLEVKQRKRRLSGGDGPFRLFQMHFNNIKASVAELESGSWLTFYYKITHHFCSTLCSSLHHSVQIQKQIKL